MENIIEKFKNEKKLIENVLNLTFINFGFEKQEYIIKNEKKIKNFFKELEEGFEINLKEIIDKNYFEKILEITKYYNKKDYEKYKIIINNTRVILIVEKYMSSKKIIISKQFEEYNKLIYTYIDSENNLILYQNINNLLGYIELFEGNDLKCNIFKINENVEYISKFPYNLVYNSINNNEIKTKEDFINYFELENKKRKSINAKEIEEEKEDKNNIERYINKINLVINSSKNIYSNFVNNLLKYELFNYLSNKENKLLENNKSEITEGISNYTDLEILVMQKKELIEIKNSTSDILKKLKNVLEKM